MNSSCKLADERAIVNLYVNSSCELPDEQVRGRPSHGGNEAEIIIIVILGENNIFAILGGRKFFAF